MPQTCLVVGCGSRSNRDIVRFFSVPTVLNFKFVINKNELSRKRRTLWLAAIKRDDLTESKLRNQRVCSRHFITGQPADLEDINHPDWVPSKNMGHKSEKIPDDEERVETLDRRKRLKVNFTYRGLCAPVFTIFNKDLSVNTQGIPEYAKFLAKNGIDGVLVHGTSGEGVSMTVAERKAVVDVWSKVVKETKQHLMVQVGGCPLPDAVEMAKHAESVGADSLLCHAELFFKPHTPSELVDYLKHVGEAAPNTPLLYYHIPGWTGININMETFINEAVQRIPTFQGIKYTSTDLEGGLAALKTNDGKHAVFLGADTLLASAFGSGFDSAIATSLNMLPQYAVKIVKAAKENNIVEARKLQHVLTQAVNVITKDGAWVPTMKVAMNLVTPINVGLARPPLKNLNEAQIEDMKKSLKALGIL